MRDYLPPSVTSLVDLALEEDTGRGDITTALTVDPGLTGYGEVVAKQDLVLSGADVFSLAMARVDPSTRVELLFPDGGSVRAGQVVMKTHGLMSALLIAERVALNFLQRLCGTATMTRRFVEALPEGCETALTDTRKTSPGMRFLERRAVRHGGGRNHRVDLSGGVLIKENHIVAAGSVEAAVSRCKAGAPHPLKVEVEVRDEDELDQALAAGADVVMLDNMAADRVARCVKIVGGRAIVEVSGGVSLETVGALAAAGPDVISVGAFTHSAPCADLSFLIRASENQA